MIPPGGVPAIRYAGVILFVAAATGLRALFDPLLGGGVPFVFHFIAIALAGWTAGMGGGVLATVTSTLVVGFMFIGSRLTFTAMTAPDLASMAVFTASGCGLSWLSSRWRASELRLAESRDHAERAAAALAAKDRTQTALMDAVAESIWLFDRDLILAANATAAARFHTTPEALRGRNWKTLLSPDLAASRAAEHEEVYRSGQPRRFEDERAGRHFEHSFYPVFGDGGTVTAVAGFSRDVTDTRQAERELQAVSQRLSYHMRHSPLAVVEFDADLRITRWAGEAERLFGWSADEVLGKRRDEFPWIHPDDVAHVADVAASLRTGATPQRRSSNRNLRKDGTVVHCEWYNSSLVDGSGALQSILSLVLDVTERTRLEEALRARAEDLARANRLKDEFLATLSHELRTPLHAILGWSDLLVVHPDTPPSLQLGLSTISRNARIQSHIVNDLLDVSRFVTGSFRLAITAVDVRDAAAQALDAVRPAAEAKHLVLRAEVAPGLLVPADAVRLQQVVWNLLANAVKFTPPGGEVVIGAQATAGDVEITVRDTGAGIPPAFLPRIFERFSQADGSLTRAHGGLGPGLAIVRHLVELHGGTVSAASEGEGRGATFLVRLPRATAGRGQSTAATT